VWSLEEVSRRCDLFITSHFWRFRHKKPPRRRSFTPSRKSSSLARRPVYRTLSFVVRPLLPFPLSLRNAMPRYSSLFPPYQFSVLFPLEEPPFRNFVTGSQIGFFILPFSVNSPRRTAHFEEGLLSQEHWAIRRHTSRRSLLRSKHGMPSTRRVSSGKVPLVGGTPALGFEVSR